MTKPKITHFSDVLCIWAYVSERRMTELHEEFGDSVEVEYRFVGVFGVGRARLEARWKDKGGLAAYAEHVRGVARQFEHLRLSPEVWTKVAPTSSSPAHLLLAATRSLERSNGAPVGAAVALAASLRRAFFQDAIDISDSRVLLDLAKDAGLASSALEALITSGEAYAELGQDIELARDLDVRVSPSLVMNEGRQRLNGNVGYRTIAANVRELLDRAEGQASWC
ncbi:MAG: DsbA family protein [Polyangiaceae bacterium]